MKILTFLFPTLDHLYIYQLLEYNLPSFLKWFLKHPFLRNLQKKHRLIFTKKMLFILVLLIIWEVFFSVYLSFKLNYHLLLTLVFLIILQPLTPVLLIFPHITYYPLDRYFKGKTIASAYQKLSGLPKLNIVAITGSYGKTSTKEILYTLLCKDYNVVKTPKSFNTPLGIAQTMLEGLKETTQILIAEIGAYKKGEIADLTKYLKPKIGIITAVGSSHLERFGSLENIALAKFEVVENLPEDAVAILNGENKWLQKLAKDSKRKIVFYGRRSDTLHVTNIKLKIWGSSFILHTPKGNVSITIPLFGLHHVQNFLSAAAAAITLGVDPKVVKQRAQFILPTPHRLEITQQGALTIIDNTYNTNPESSQVSLKLLNDYPGEQKIVMTPGLVELGEREAEENRLFAQSIAQVADGVIIIGEYAKDYLLKGLDVANFPRKNIHLVTSTYQGLNLLSKIAKPNAVVLLENDLPDQYI